MATLSFDPSLPTAPMKPVHGVGQPPMLGTDFSMFHFLTEAGIPFSRLHDVGGVYGQNRFVDIPNLFRDFDADPEDPQSYDFAFTDLKGNALDGMNGAVVNVHIFNFQHQVSLSSLPR